MNGLQFGIWCLLGIIFTLNEISLSTHYKPKFSPLIAVVFWLRQQTTRKLKHLAGCSFQCFHAAKLTTTLRKIDLRETNKFVHHWLTILTMLHRHWKCVKLLSTVRTTIIYKWQNTWFSWSRFYQPILINRDTTLFCLSNLKILTSWQLLPKQITNSFFSLYDLTPLFYMHMLKGFKGKCKIKY